MTTSNPYPHLFQPIKLGKHLARNRVMRLATTSILAEGNRAGPLHFPVPSTALPLMASFTLAKKTSRLPLGERRNRTIERPVPCNSRIVGISPTGLLQTVRFNFAVAASQAGNEGLEVHVLGNEMHTAVTKQEVGTTRVEGERLTGSMRQVR